MRDDLLSRLVAALRGEPGAGMQALAEQAVAAFAGLGTGRLAGSERYYQYRVLRQLDVSELLLRAMRLGEQDGPPGLERRLAAIEQQDRLQDLRTQIAAELRRQLANLGGAESLLDRHRSAARIRTVRVRSDIADRTACGAVSALGGSVRAGRASHR